MEYVYTIRCPLTDFVVYVGKTKNLRHRFGCHKRASDKTSEVGRWCKAMLSIGLEPNFNIEREVEYVCQEEDLLIDFYRSIGMATFNRTTTYFGIKSRPYKRFFNQQNQLSMFSGKLPIGYYYSNFKLA